MCLWFFSDNLLLCGFNPVHFHLEFLQNLSLVFHLLLHLLGTQFLNQLSTTRCQNRTGLGVTNDMTEVVTLEDPVLDNQTGEAHNVPNN